MIKFNFSLYAVTEYDILDFGVHNLLEHIHVIFSNLGMYMNLIVLFLVLPHIMIYSAVFLYTKWRICKFIIAIFLSFCAVKTIAFFNLIEEDTFIISAYPFMHLALFLLSITIIRMIYTNNIPGMSREKFIPVVKMLKLLFIAFCYIVFAYLTITFCENLDFNSDIGLKGIIYSTVTGISVIPDADLIDPEIRTLGVFFGISIIYTFNNITSEIMDQGFLLDFTRLGNDIYTYIIRAQTYQALLRIVWLPATSARNNQPNPTIFGAAFRWYLSGMWAHLGIELKTHGFPFLWDEIRQCIHLYFSHPILMYIFLGFNPYTLEHVVDAHNEIRHNLGPMFDPWGQCYVRVLPNRATTETLVFESGLPYEESSYAGSDESEGSNMSE